MRLLTWVLALLFLAVQYTLWLGKGGARDVARLEEAVAAQTTENAALKARNEGLEAEVMDLKQGLDAIEELARSEMGMVKQGEVFFQIMDQAPGLANAGSPAQSQGKSR